MDFSCLTREFEGYFFEAFRLVSDDPREGALAWNQFVFGSVALAVGDEAVGFGRGYAQFEYRARGEEFCFGPVRFESRIVEFRQRGAGLVRV